MTSSWRHRAACTACDPNLFVEPGGHEPGKVRYDRIQAAFVVCRSCPVVAECLTAGVAGRESGVWGGTLLTSGVLDRFGMRRPSRAGKTHVQVAEELAAASGGAR